MARLSKKKRVHMEASNQLNFHLPDDILMKILLLLPFEILLVFKLVSKQWKNHINDPNFLKLYRSRSSLTVFCLKNELYCLLTRHGNKILGTIEGRRHPPFTVHRLPVDMRGGFTKSENSRYYWRKDKLLSGSSDGVACLHVINGDFIFYNMFNGSSFTVADAPLRRHFFDGWHCFGSGYDRFANDYKIMVACKYDAERKWRLRWTKIDTSTVQNQNNSMFWVYSVRNNLWKPLEGFPDTAFSGKCPPVRPRACSFNGVLHWVITKPETENKQVIVTYDLHTCRFGEISVPTAFDIGCVAEIAGHLCYWPAFGVFAKYELWVMKEYGVEESWTELINTSRKDVVHALSELKPTKLYECPNGRKGVLFVCHYKGSLHWYDIEKDEIKVIRKATWCKRRGNDQSQKQDFGYITKFLG